MSSERLYQIKTVAHPSAPAGSPTKYANRYLRLHGGGINAIMVMPSPPVFLRGHFEPSPSATATSESDGATQNNNTLTETRGSQHWTSWKPEHQGRVWGLELKGRGDKARWQPAEIVEHGGDECFLFKTDEGNGEELVHVPIEAGLGSSAGSEGTNEWKGWMVCEWAHGHPQLFWVTQHLTEPLPEFCERVILVKEYMKDGQQGDSK